MATMPPRASVPAAAAAQAALFCARLLFVGTLLIGAPAGAAAGQSAEPGGSGAPDGVTATADGSERVRGAVTALFAMDAERVTRASEAEGRQNIARQELSVCIDPRSARLSAESRVWIETAGLRVRLLLDEGLEVLSVSAAGGDELVWSRQGEAIVVSAPPGAEAFPRQVEIRYQGELRPSAERWVSDQLVVLGAGSRWFPVSEVYDPAPLRIESRCPEGFSSVVSGALAGMAPPRDGEDGCGGGDVWEIRTPVTGACIVVGRVESALTVTGDVFVGYHLVSGAAGGSGASRAPEGTDRSVSFGGREDTGGSGRSASSGSAAGPGAFEPPGGGGPGAFRAPGAVPQELIELLHFLEGCYGAYPYEWLNLVWIPTPLARATSVLSGPGFVVIRGPQEPPSGTAPMDAAASGLSDSWWKYWTDPGALVQRSLATWAQLAWLDTTGDEDGVLRLRGLRRAQLMVAMHDAARGASLSDCLGPSSPADDRICVGKGSAIFEMLSAVIGRDAYCSALRSVTETSGGTHIGLGDLAGEFERAAGRDLDWFFYEWMVRDDLPSYALEYEATPVGGGVYLLKGEITQQGEFFRTPVPLTIDLGGWSYDETIEIGSSHQRFELRTDARPMQVTIDGHHLIPKIDSSERADLHFRKGSAAAASGDWARAVDELGAAVSLEGDNADYLSAYADALVRDGRPREGLEALERAVRAEPSNADLRLRAASLYLKSDRFGEALAQLDACVHSRADDARLQVHRAVALTGLGRLDEAEEALARARELEGDATTRAGLEEELALARGRLSEARGDTLGAVRAYEAALAINPVSDEARRRLEALAAPGGGR